MTEKDKARELVNKMYVGFVHDLHSYKARQCALICVDEILKLPFENQSERNYWEEVKNEIEKL